MALLDRVLALRKGPRDQQAFLAAAADMGVLRLERYRVAGDYYDGNHRVKLTAREKTYLEASGLPYAENFCETIVDTHAARLMVTGFGSDNEALGTFARDLWEENRMDAEQGKVHRGMVKLGDYFAVVEPNAEGLPRICPNRPHNVKVEYDSGEPIYAVKKWDTSRKSATNPRGQAIRRMNIYWPDLIEKWWTDASDGDWNPFIENEGDGPSEPWVMPDGMPIGIPVVHFANKPDPHYGRSHLRGVIPQQDALNKSLLDHFWVMDAQGWPQQWGSGTSASNIQRHPGSLWTTESPDARFGQLDPADPEKSIASAESQLKRMASRSHTPLHLMLAGGNLPSGETLKTSESGLTRVTVERHYATRHKWVDVQRLGARIETAFGQGNPPLKGRLSTRWERAESRVEVDEANTAVLWQALGVSQDTILSRLGFDPVEEATKREKEGGSVDAAAFLDAARKMQAPVSSESLGGGRQPAQDPANARVPV